MALLSDKEQKIPFKKIDSADPESYSLRNPLKKNGFHRYRCGKKIFNTFNKIIYYE
ncbi:MAG: hypothetical protein ACTSPA_06780 [Promethearchaeota archaeon]